MADWLTANEALALLGTLPQTLYANVSRGRIKAKPDPSDSRRSLYRGDDVRRLAQRSAGRRKQEAVAAEAIRWGEPVLTTSISTIHNGRLIYRGQDAVALAEKASLEDVAALLWSSAPFQLPTEHGSLIADLRTALTDLASHVANAPPSFGRNQRVLIVDAVHVLRIVAQALAPQGCETDPLHVRLAKTWNCRDAADVFRRALVLLADHELNASTFAARVAVSTGASLAAGVLAGMAALTGPLHGGAATAVQRLASEVDGLGGREAVMQRLGQGLPMPAFGHHLYPEGDVRAAHLLEQFTLPPAHAALLDAATNITGDPPNIDFALAAMTSAFDLPSEAPLMLFALARTTGWLAHALEQVREGHLIRPRANYIEHGAA